MRNFNIVILFAICNTAIAFDCNNFRPQPEINITRMIGQWNVHQLAAESAANPKSTPTCLHTTLFQVTSCEKNEFEYIANFDVEYEIISHTTINRIFPNSDRKGLWEIESISQSGKAWQNIMELHIIHTDYNIALAALCEKAVGHSELIYVGMVSKSREPLEESIVATYKYLLSISGVEPYFEEITDDCTVGI